MTGLIVRLFRSTQHTRADQVLGNLFMNVFPALFIFPLHYTQRKKEPICKYLAKMGFLTRVILAIVSFAPGLIGSSVPRGDLGWMSGRNEPLARPAGTASALPSGNYGVIPTKYLHDYKTTQHRKKESINLAPIVDSTIEEPEPSIHTGFFLVVLLPALTFVAAISGEARIRTARVMRGYYLEKRARIHLEHKLGQAEDEKAQLALHFLDIDQALRVKEEQRKEAAHDVNDLREKLAQLAHNEFLLRKDLALSKENIQGLQATVAKKGKEALEYRAQAYRTTREIPPTQMSRLRFGGGQTMQNPAAIPHHVHTAARDQSNHARSTESEVDGGGRNVITGGTRETSVGKRPADGNISRYTPTW